MQEIINPHKYYIAYIILLMSHYELAAFRYL